MFVDSASEAGIDIVSYASLPIALREALVSVVSAFVLSIFTSGGNDFITLCYNITRLFSAHYPELCLAWLQIQDSNYDSEGQKIEATNAYRIARIDCPVDVEVYDESNRLVAQFTNDEPQDLNSIIVCDFTADGEKVIYLPTDQDYRIKMTATDNGEVNYSVSEFSYDIFNYSRIVTYPGVAISKGDTLSASVSEFTDNEKNDTAEGSSRDYSLYKGSEKLTPSIDVKGEAAENSVYAVSVVNNNEDGGTLIGGGTYTTGSFAQVTAVPFDGCTFDGWYIDGTRVSTDTEYRFAVTKDTDLTANFIGTRITPETDPDAFTSIIITANNGGSIIQGSTGYYKQGDEVTIKASPSSGYIFSGWTSSSSNVVFASKESESTTFTVPDSKEEITITATFNRSDGSDLPTYKINSSITSNGKVTVNPTTAKSGTKVIITATPDQGYIIDSIAVTDKEGTVITVLSESNGTYTFTMPSSDVTVTAKFVAEKTSWSNPFLDVSNNNWFYEEVAYVAQKGLMQGISSNKFNPYGTATRGMIVTILYRMEGSPTGFSSKFKDVERGSWYSNAVAWAASNGIVDGYGNGKFGPDDSITREQLATILYRYAMFVGYNKTDFSDLSNYTDANTVSDWALLPLCWANKQGLVNGRTSTTLVPRDTANRAEIATIFTRFCKNIANID